MLGDAQHVEDVEKIGLDYMDFTVLKPLNARKHTLEQGEIGVSEKQACREGHSVVVEGFIRPGSFDVIPSSSFG
ncbi:hypothetical protein SUGI_0823650 [Cryptomeria japonica]|nr:hypothetical protein SUGI_0823650 [Cryptomeria japonica]